MTPFEISVLRFTPRVDEMRRFLALLGLEVELEAERGNYLELAGSSGRVHLHHADAVATHLVLRCPSVAQAHADLDARGIETERWDEAYGEQMFVPGPGGARIEVAEAQADLHGYRLREVAGRGPRVSAVWYTPDVAGDAAAFVPYGFEPHGYGDENWQELRSALAGGALGMHALMSGHAPSAGGDVELALTTAEALDDVEARLRDAGFDTTRFADEFISYVGVTDPDGIELQVHAAAD